VGCLDWVQNQRNTFFGRYFIDDYSNPAVDVSKNLLVTTRAGLQQCAQSIVLGNAFSITSSLFNSFHLGFVRLAVNRAQSIGMPSPTTLGVNMYNPVDDFTDLAVTNYFTVGGGSNAPASFIRNQWQLADDLDFTKGRHHLSFGAEWITGQMDENNLQYANGEFNFNGSRSGDPLADLMLGALNTVIDSNYARVDMRQKYFGGYYRCSTGPRKALPVLRVPGNTRADGTSATQRISTDCSSHQWRLQHDAWRCLPVLRESQAVNHFDFLLLRTLCSEGSRTRH